MTFHLKDESGGRKLKSVYASSAKVTWKVLALIHVISVYFQSKRFPLYFFLQQHIVTYYDPEGTYPFASFSNDLILTKKVKGIPRSRHDQVTLLDFRDVSVHNRPSRVVLTASLKKTSFQIFLLRSKKRLLSRFSVKRLYDDRFRRKHSYFSFPLNWKGKIIK